MKKAEAREKQVQSNKDAQEKWCPFINGKCKYTCVCYSEGRLSSIKGTDFVKKVEDDPKYLDGVDPAVRKSFDEGWNVFDAGCTNFLVTGEVYVDH